MRRNGDGELVGVIINILERKIYEKIREIKHSTIKYYFGSSGLEKKYPQHEDCNLRNFNRACGIS
jgi:hypothetical protein